MSNWTKTLGESFIKSITVTIPGTFITKCSNFFEYGDKFDLKIDRFYSFKKGNEKLCMDCDEISDEVVIFNTINIPKMEEDKYCNTPLSRAIEERNYKEVIEIIKPVYNAKDIKNALIFIGKCANNNILRLIFKISQNAEFRIYANTKDEFDYLGIDYDETK